MSIVIVEKSKDFSKVEQYLMTTSPNINSMKDVPDGEKITVAGWLTFEDEKKGGEVSHITSIITPDNETYAFQSQTFAESLFDIDSIMEGQIFTIVKTSGTTKAGRPYINCYLDTESL